MVEPNQGRGRSRSGRGNKSRNRAGRARTGQGTKNKKLVLPDDAIVELGENIYVVNQPG